MVKKLSFCLAIACFSAGASHAGERPVIQFDAADFRSLPPQEADTIATIAVASRLSLTFPLQTRPNVRALTVSYGPFRVTRTGTAVLIGATDADTPAQFYAMLHDHPEIRRIEFIEAPGTYDDRANLRLGRMIRAAGLATHVPAGGSVRSGAVELFLAGTRRSIADSAEFAVHSWQDATGREANDYSPDATQNSAYLTYYREMGLSADGARRFYDFTNAVPHVEALWLKADEMRRLLSQNEVKPQLAAVAPPMAPPPVSSYDVTIALTFLDLSVLDQKAISPAFRSFGMLDLGIRTL